jgi:hypothetical protein
MTGEVIKQFLVSLGFGVDDKSLKGFTKALTGAVTKVTAMAAAVKVMAAGTFIGIAKISEGFEELGYSTRMIAPAINKAILLRKAMMSAYKDAGINIVQAVQQSIKFNFSLAKTRFQLEGIVKSTAIKFLPMLTKQMDIFRQKVSANMPKILAVLERFVKFIFKAFEGVVLLGARLWSILGRVWDLLEKLDDITGGWSTKIIAVVAAWKLLNLAFITTPIGMILTGLIALLALYDDFMTWQEGGDSLFDWGAWIPAIDAFTDAMKIAWDAIKQMWSVVTSLWGAFKKLFSGDFKGFFGGLADAASKLLGVLKSIYDYWAKIFEFGGKFGGAVLDKVTGLFSDSPALGSTTNTTANTQQVKQETNIHVHGVSDPKAAASTVMGGQQQVNANLARNMKGAAR